jgi:diaminohydroxyphosphoribosylaminopyrimidine deaminase/5-amino-6-(5-phosphoribosylamino)uracil reductase
MRAIDKKFMRRAIELALKGEGQTSPNPAVGAVVVKNGRIVGEGFHRKAGAAHAEVVALKEAGSRAKGSDLYVTLEPCCHYGRTPPCCNTIISSKVRRVIVGMRDVNPIVRGMGIKILKDNGIGVTEGVLKSECENINPAYLKWIATGMPYVTLKVALSLDGKIATKSGDSKWITNELCREYVHKLRDSSDAIIVGATTALKDDPRLTVRLPGKAARNKIAVVLDEKLSLPLTSSLGKRRSGLVVATTSNASVSKIRKFERKGHKVIVCRSTGDGRVFLPHLLRSLGSFGITSVLVEGGAEVHSDFLRRGLADRVVACIAPKFIGRDGKEWLPGISVNRMKYALRLRNVCIKIFGDNVVLDGFPSFVRRGQWR